MIRGIFTNSIPTSQGQRISKEEAFNSILHELSMRNEKIDPWRWIAICGAAVNQDNNVPEELSPESFTLLKELAKNNSTSSFLSRDYPAGLVKFAAIAFIGMYGEKFFNKQQFRGDSFKKWLDYYASDMDQSSSLNVKYISEKYLNEITLNKGEISFGGSQFKKCTVNINAPFITKTNADGSRYFGRIKNGMRTNYGVNHYSDGAVYTGYWKNDKRDGYGLLECPNGEEFDGLWLEDMKHGAGTYKYADGSYYAGAWFKDKREGLGALIFSENVKYEGDWKNDKKEGMGVEFFSDGSRYKGSLKDGKRHGYGTIYYPSGSKYQGLWENDKRHGAGTLIYEIMGNKYMQFEGTWRNGLKEGRGTSFYPDGAKCEGSWVKDQQVGPVIYTFPDGTCYAGSHEQIKEQIFNSLLIENNNKFEGYLQNIYNLKDNIEYFKAKLADCRKFYKVLLDNQYDIAETNSKVVMLASGDEVHIITLNYFLKKIHALLQDVVDGRPDTINIRKNPQDQSLITNNFLSPNSIKELDSSKIKHYISID